MISKTCEYAIRATIYIASESSAGKRCGIRDIARKIESPEPFTAKILQRLVIEKIQLKQIKLDQLIKAIDGNDLFDRCSLGLHDCSDKQPCPFHHKYKPLRENIKKTLKSTSIHELISTYNSGDSFLKL